MGNGTDMDSAYMDLTVHKRPPSYKHIHCGQSTGALSAGHSARDDAVLASPQKVSGFPGTLVHTLRTIGLDYYVCFLEF